VSEDYKDGWDREYGECVGSESLSLLSYILEYISLEGVDIKYLSVGSR
jgi:hypothetical protein